MPVQNLTWSTTLVYMECGKCGVPFGMSEALHAAAKRDHSMNWYCPNGHPRHFIGETDAEKYARLYDYQRDRSAALAAERDGAQASLRATRGVVTKMRKRVVAAMCPFGCDRKFAGLAEHVAKVHPGLDFDV